MSDNDANASGKKGWSDEELLNCLLQAISQPDIKPDLEKIIYPTGRNASGFKQKLGHLKRALQNNGNLQSGANIKQAAAVAKRAGSGGGRKRKADDADGEKPAPKKQGRAKKAVSEAVVEPEPEVEVEMEEEEIKIKPENFDDVEVDEV